MNSVTLRRRPQGDANPRPAEEEEVRVHFPWRAVVLGVSRLVVGAGYMYCSPRHLMVKGNWKVEAAPWQQLGPRNKFLNWRQVPVLSLSVCATPAAAWATVISALATLLAVALYYLRSHKYGDKGQGEEPPRSYEYLVPVTYFLITFGLLVAATDLVTSTSSTIIHASMLDKHVGSNEALCFFLAAGFINIINFYLWLGALEFQRSLHRFIHTN